MYVFCQVRRKQARSRDCKSKRRRGSTPPPTHPPGGSRTTPKALVDATQATRGGPPSALTTLPHSTSVPRTPRAPVPIPRPRQNPGLSEVSTRGGVGGSERNERKKQPMHSRDLLRTHIHAQLTDKTKGGSEFDTSFSWTPVQPLLTHTPAARPSISHPHKLNSSTCVEHYF